MNTLFTEDEWRNRVIELIEVMELLEKDSDRKLESNIEEEVAEGLIFKSGASFTKSTLIGILNYFGIEHEARSRSGSISITIEYGDKDEE